MMINKTVEITQFLKKNYSPSTIQETKNELQLTTSEVLILIFKIFPNGCIDDYDLHNLLITLGYEPQKRGVIDFVWCLKEN